MDGILINPYQFATPGVYDADAADYIARVNTADAANGAPGGLEQGLQDIIHSLFSGLKEDASPNGGVSNFAAFGAANLLAGPRTRQGCAVPLLATMPTPILIGYSAGDYNRKAGLSGGTGRGINTQRNNNADPQNNCSFSVFATAVGTTDATARIMLGSQIIGTNQKIIIVVTSTNSGHVSFRCQDAGAQTAGLGFAVPGLIGASRNSSASYTITNNNQTATITAASTTPGSQNIFVGSTTTDGSTVAFPSDATCAFYHIGRAVNLLPLHARVLAYRNALNALTLT